MELHNNHLLTIIGEKLDLRGGYFSTSFLPIVEANMN